MYIYTGIARKYFYPRYFAPRRKHETSENLVLISG